MGRRHDAATPLSWDWKLKIRGLQFECVRVSLPHTNIMLVDQWNRDYGWTASLDALARVIDAMP